MFGQENPTRSKKPNFFEIAMNLSTFHAKLCFFVGVRYESPTIETVEINVVMNVITHCILTNRAGDRKVKPFGRKNPTSV